MALVVKNLSTNAGDLRHTSSIPGLGRSPGGGHGNPLQYSCLNPKDRGVWRATVHRVAKSWTWLRWLSTKHLGGFPGGSDGKASTCNFGRPGFDPWVVKIPWRRAWQPTPVLLPGEFHGQRSLAGYSPWGHKESDTTEQLSTAQQNT